MEFVAQEEDAGRRIDQFVCERAEMTRSSAVGLIENGNVTVNGEPVRKNYRVRYGDAVVVIVPEPVLLNAEPEDIPLDIVYEDDVLLVVNKPQGMVVHPAAGNYTGTLVNALLAHCGDSLSGINGVIRPGIVHRIDKDTSGLLIVAKTNDAHIKLAEQIREHSFLRVYNGIVYGHLKQDGTVNLPIGRDPKNRKKMTVTYQNSKPAITHYRTLTPLCGSALMEFQLETGRTHQIRVHMAHLGHAIYGDPVYSPGNISKKLLTGQYLHAKTIGFTHPVTGENMRFETPLPRRFDTFIQKHLLERFDYEKKDF